MIIIKYMNSMRILFINRHHFVGGGADQVYLNTGKLMEENGHDVAYFSSKNEQNDPSGFNDFFVENVKMKNEGFLSKIKSVKKYLYNKEAEVNLKRLIIKFKPDVAHIHLFYGVLSASILQTLNDLKIPVVITIHDYRLLCPVNAMLDKEGNICEKCKGNNFNNCITKRCSAGNIFQSTVVAFEAYMRKYKYDPLNLINHFIFVSKFSRDKHISFDYRYQSKSSHLYNFSHFCSEKVSKRGDYLLYYGRISIEKGILTLIKAVKKTNSKLLIAGRGPQLEEILNEIKGFPNIIYVGFKSGKEIVDLIENCSFVMVPSEWYENNPMTIVESFSLGKPVIGSRVGGIPELINSNTGFIFEMGDEESLALTIEKAKNITIQEYSKISNECLNFAATHFSKDNHINALLKVYESINNGGK
jgi:glycosyltransferase involved in cell wall biosynthesis